MINRYIEYNFVSKYPIESYKWNDTMDQLQRSIADLFGNTINGVIIKYGICDDLLTFFENISLVFYTDGSPNISDLEKTADSIIMNFDELKRG